VTGNGWCTATQDNGHARNVHVCIHQREHKDEHRCACGERWRNDRGAVSA
jgi:hypothetical protein